MNCGGKEDAPMNPNSPSETSEGKEPGRKLGSLGRSNAMKKRKRDIHKKPKTKFQEFLEMELGNGGISAKEDLEMERKLVKKLKVKGGVMGGDDDGLNFLLEGIPSVLDSELEDVIKDYNSDSDEESKEHVTSRKKQKRKKSKKKKKTEDGETQETGMAGGGSEKPCGIDEGEPRQEASALDMSVKYVAPHLRACVRNDSEQVLNRVKGLLNRLSESNTKSVAEEVATIFQSASHSVGPQIIGEVVVTSCLTWPQVNEENAAGVAAFVAGIACLVGIDCSAKIIASVAKSFEDKFSEDDDISLEKLTLLLSFMYLFGVYSSDLIYDFLSVLSKRMTKLDVSTILKILQCCGMKLRDDDPTAMIDFVLSIQKRVNELKSLSEPTQDMKKMLETIRDIKNNCIRSKEDPAYLTRLRKWLKELRAEDILLGGLRWSKLLDPQKKGQWWLSGGIASTHNVEEVATIINREVVGAQKLLELAAAQRMNTDVRRAVFCIIMSAEDYIDAFEKILRLDLSGKQDREIMRVLVDCCLQEKVFNKYYTTLASKLCSHDKNHKFTLQYCLWDHFKELASMELNRSMNLARFVAEMLSRFVLSLSILKTVDLMDPNQLTPKRIMHFRMLFEAIFANTDALVWNIFTRIASVPELESLRNIIVVFIKQYVVAANPEKLFAAKFKIAKKALENEAGVLM